MAYASPEQLEDAKNVDHRADIYGVGATLYHLVSGESPRVVKSDALPERLRAVIMKALSERPKDRFFSVDDMARALGGSATPVTPQPPPASGEYCPNPDCRAPTPEGLKYCSRCGTGLFEPCPNPDCEGAFRADTVFCGECGTDIKVWKKAEEHLSRAKELGTSFKVEEAVEECKKALDVHSGYKEASALLKKLEALEMKDFTLEREETFACGGQTHTVLIYRHNQTGLEFVFVPGGSFEMGANSGDSCEKPVHRVDIEPFLFCRTPVTQRVWKGVMSDNPSYFRGGKAMFGLVNRGGGDDHPVENVTWNVCTEFCRRTGLRLPSESEWEYACRAGTDTKYYFGQSESDLGEHSWYTVNSSRRTHRVAQKKPNAFGLFDMHGNVWEWCSDKWHDDYNGAPTNGSSWESSGSSRRVLRGGSWYGSSGYWRSADRSWLAPGDRRSGLGFRPAFSLPLNDWFPLAIGLFSSSPFFFPPAKQAGSWAPASSRRSWGFQGERSPLGNFFAIQHS